jgi:hypothetical protein
MMHFIRLKGLRLLIKIANTTNNNTNRYEKQYITVLRFFSLGFCYGQLSPKVGGNPYLIESSAAFEVQSTTKGLLYPRMTTIERDAIGVAATGLIIYNTTAACVQWYRGCKWGLV